MVAEALSRQMIKGRGLAIVKGPDLVQGRPKISNFQFLDDNLLFCADYGEELFGVKAMLMCFKLVSRLKVNLGKSCVMGVDLEEVVRALVEGMECGVGKIPFTYLGPLVGATARSKCVVLYH